jgi:hypothetical protein
MAGAGTSRTPGTALGLDDGVAGVVSVDDDAAGRDPPVQATRHRDTPTATAPAVARLCCRGIQRL